MHSLGMYLMSVMHYKVLSFIPSCHQLKKVHTIICTIRFVNSRNSSFLLQTEVSVVFHLGFLNNGDCFNTVLTT